MNSQSAIDLGLSYDLSATDPHCTGHRVDAQPILIGMVAATLATQAAFDEAAQWPVRLRRLVWSRPVVPGRDDGRLAAIRQGDLLGVDVVPARAGVPRTRGFECVVEAVGGPSATAPAGLEPRLLEALLRAGGSAALYQGLACRGFEHDALLRVIDRVHVEADRIVFSAAARPVERERGMPLSPILMHAVVCALLSLADFGDDSAMPVSVATMDVLRPLHEHAIGVLRLVRRTDDTLVADAQLYDRHGDRKSVV